MRSQVSAILLAGGTGHRMNNPTPKQYLTLHGKMVARYSFEILMQCPEVDEIIVVCEPHYQKLFVTKGAKTPIKFALPGPRRQDSVWNGLQAVSANSEMTCIHDSARPCITLPIVQRVLVAAFQHGAATVGMPMKFTIKEQDELRFVKNTPDRTLFWEIQTPQAIKTNLLKEGFKEVFSKGLNVTDDVSIIEHLQLPVKLVEGCYSNIKITTADDLYLAELLLKESLDSKKL